MIFNQGPLPLGQGGLAWQSTSDQACSSMKLTYNSIHNLLLSFKLHSQDNIHQLSISDWHSKAIHDKLFFFDEMAAIEVTMETQFLIDEQINGKSTSGLENSLSVYSHTLSNTNNSDLHESYAN